jgi:hypothetical protein
MGTANTSLGDGVITILPFVIQQEVRYICFPTYYGLYISFPLEKWLRTILSISAS